MKRQAHKAEKMLQSASAAWNRRNMPPMQNKGDKRAAQMQRSRQYAQKQLVKQHSTQWKYVIYGVVTTKYTGGNVRHDDRDNKKTSQKSKREREIASRICCWSHCASHWQSRYRQVCRLMAWLYFCRRLCCTAQSYHSKCYYLLVALNTRNKRASSIGSMPWRERKLPTNEESRSDFIDGDWRKASNCM